MAIYCNPWRCFSLFPPAKVPDSLPCAGDLPVSSYSYLVQRRTGQELTGAAACPGVKDFSFVPAKSLALGRHLVGQR